MHSHLYDSPCSFFCSVYILNFLDPFSWSTESALVHFAAFREAFLRIRSEASRTSVWSSGVVIASAKASGVEVHPPQGGGGGGGGGAEV